MKGNTINVAILAVLWAIIVAAGGYFTFVHQPRTLDHLREAQRMTQLRQDEAGALRLQQAGAESEAREAYLRWSSRYKVFPDSLATHEVVAYFNSLTRRGFKHVDVVVKESQQASDYSYHMLEVKGQASYGALHRFVWDLENNRLFYRLRTLTISEMDLNEEDSEGRPRFEVVVSFTMEVEALYGGADGLSAPPAGVITQASEVAPSPSNRPPVVPAALLPNRQPVINPFYPAILSQIPPNTYGLLDIEEASFVAIAGGNAIFSDADGWHTVGVGDAVYLGQITSVDAQRGVVTARLNKGGILDRVVRRMEGKDDYRPVQRDGTPAAQARSTGQ
jgi:hypothetical protein